MEVECVVVLSWGRCLVTLQFELSSFTSRVLLPPLQQV